MVSLNLQPPRRQAPRPTVQVNPDVALEMGRQHVCRLLEDVVPAPTLESDRVFRMLRPDPRTADHLRERWRPSLELATLAEVALTAG
jgi:hypothetical protein